MSILRHKVWAIDDYLRREITNKHEELCNNCINQSAANKSVIYNYPF